MMLYIFGVFYVTMSAAGIIMNLAFGALHWVPSHPTRAIAMQPAFSINYTFWLNLVLGALVLYLWLVNRRNPMMHHHAEMQHE